MKVNRRSFLAVAAGAAARLEGQPKTPGRNRTVYVVPNFHPASCGWLTTFSKERVFCTNSYLDHLDRVRDDPNYAFVLSEVNNLIAIMNFRPDRVPESGSAFRRDGSNWSTHSSWSLRSTCPAVRLSSGWAWKASVGSRRYSGYGRASHGPSMSAERTIKWHRSHRAWGLTPWCTPARTRPESRCTGPNRPTARARWQSLPGITPN